ncbi:MAG: MBL fold metallo-hydrolase [Rhodothermia bacterium]|nr:MAG: MBL fold metallo-hydrolase [Rhodothermia bacterium]
MALKSFTFNPFSTNCFLVESEGEAVIVDPACMTEAEISAVVDYVSENGLVIKNLLLTHGHIDHIFGCNALSDVYGLDWRIHVDDVPLLENAPLQAKMIGLPLETPNPPGAALADGDQVSFGTVNLDVVHTPGHSPGSVSFINQEEKYVIVGDVLFRGSIGRTDLWQGSLPVLMQSIFQKIVPLGNAFTVYSGHGPETTIGDEIETNPFLTGSNDFGL